MKPSFQHLGFDSVDASFLCFWVRSPKFGFHWHYHPEIEISYVLKGRGTRLVGDNVQEFQEGDLLMLGPDLPHTLISDDLYVSRNGEMEVVVIQFPKALIEQRSIEIVELSEIGGLVNASHRGLAFELPALNGIKEKLTSLPELQGFRQYHGLLDILHELSQSTRIPLASEVYSPNRSSDTEAKIGKVCTYIHEHFSENVEIETLAELAHMNEAAFCRFFKKMTGKTAVTYVNDLRIGKACELLRDESLSINQIAYESGYNSITHFNRSFLKRKETTPSEFRRNYAYR